MESNSCPVPTASWRLRAASVAIAAVAATGISLGVTAAPASAAMTRAQAQCESAQEDLMYSYYGWWFGYYVGGYDSSMYITGMNIAMDRLRQGGCPGV